MEANVGPGEAGGPARRLGDERVVINADRLAGSWWFEAKGQLQRHRLIEISDSASTESEAFNLLLQTASLDLLAHHSRGKGFRGTIGLSGLLQGNNASGRIPLVPNANLAAGGTFAFEQLTAGKWSQIGRASCRERV